MSAALAAAAALIAAAILVLPTPARGRLPDRGPARARRRGSPRALRLRHRPRSLATDPFEAAASYDLFAACLAAGTPTVDAARTVAVSAPPALAELLGRAAELLALGDDPERAWRHSGDDPVVAGLARLLRRSARAGSAPAAGLAELARAEREAAENGAVEAGERAGVAVSGPLGLCFLPAFVATAIVPVVLGLAGDVLGVGPR